MTVDLIDLHHTGHPQLIGSYLLETPEGPALFDCGPASCLPALKQGLSERGLELTEVKHLLLSHIHLDHAGAAGVIAREHPGVEIHVSAVGAPHLVDPTRLEASARRLYGDAFDDLWGELVAVPEANVHVVGEHVLGLECFPSPGHARHHVSYLDGDGTLYAGDSLGVRKPPARFVLPPTPPPEIDLEAWEQTLLETERRSPARFALTHCGSFDDVEEHIARLRTTLAAWADRVAGGMDEASFIAAARADCAASDPELVATYDLAAPYWQCFRGLQRYWRKKAEA